jgi:uncharacterized membrane protein YeaQ/YmgE (transglycosylase-associated protein family)
VISEWWMVGLIDRIQAAGAPNNRGFIAMCWSFLVTILIGLLVGWLAGQITKGKGFGLFGNIGVGIVGALLGRLLFDLIGLEYYSLLGRIVMALVGALLLLYVLGVTRRR